MTFLQEYGTMWRQRKRRPVSGLRLQRRNGEKHESLQAMERDGYQHECILL